jgi:glycosyltransferase involved in cell wall biosynthesis
VLSQTFVRREVAALRQTGVELVVVADGAEDEDLLGEEGRALAATTRYTSTIGEEARNAFLRRLARRRPLALANTFLFIASRRYGPWKAREADWTVFHEALALGALLEDERPDRLHAPWADRCAFVALVASRLLRVPFSVQARAHELHDPGFRHPLPDVFRHADLVVTNTAYNVPFIRAHLGRRRSPPVHVVHNGLDLHRFVPRGADGSPAHRPPGPARLLCVARLVEQKGLLVLMRACAVLRDRGVEAACDVVGGPEEPLYTEYLLELRREHRRLQLDGRVRFAGSQPFERILDAYRTADVFVLPCVVAADGRRDVTPNVVLEAMAMALPVVSTPVGGVPELVEDGVSGVLVPPGDAAALAAALEALIADPERRRRLGEAARRRIEERFDARLTAARFRELFIGGG